MTKKNIAKCSLEVAETILGYFGFDRTIYGDAIQTKNRKWWYNLNDERRKDIDTERNIHDGEDVINP